MIKNYRKKVGQRTGGIKLYAELKQDFINQEIKIGRDKLYCRLPQFRRDCKLNSV